MEKRRTQRGDMLLEAMVGMIIVGLVSAASVYTVGRSAKAQNGANVRAQVIEQVRAQLIQQGPHLCGNLTNVTVNGNVQIPVTITCQQYVNASVQLPGLAASAVAVAATQASQITASASAPGLWNGTLTVTSN